MPKKCDRFIQKRQSIEELRTKINFKKVEDISDTIAKRNYHQVVSNCLGLSSLSTNNTKRTHYTLHTSEDILDAPGLVDNYYHNVLDWSSNNYIGVALGNKVYIYNVQKQETEYFCSHSYNYTSLSWSPDGSNMAVGTDDGKIHIYDISTKVRTNVFEHDRCIPALSWNRDVLSSGCSGGIIKNWDKSISRPCIATMHSHEEEICGLKWNPSGTQLASGGDDNVLCIWDASYKQLHRIDAHKAAVKAIAWCPWKRNLIATGGGTEDKCIKLWDTVQGKMNESIDTKSQVCALLWNPRQREILSSHGFTQNQLCLWEYPTMTKMKEFFGHSSRVLHMACSPDGSTVVSASSDETLRFWKPFGNPVSAKNDEFGHFTIR